MKARFFWFVLVAGLSGAAMAEPALGVWKTQLDEGNWGHVRIETCGSNLCGFITRSIDATGTERPEFHGRKVVIDMAPDGQGRVVGKRHRPLDGKTYAATLALEGDRLRVRACLAGGLLCRSQMWSRVLPGADS